MKPNNRQKALALIINDIAEKIDIDHYKWRSLYYEVKPYSEIRKKGTRGGNITKYVYITYAKVKYGIREIKP